MLTRLFIFVSFYFIQLSDFGLSVTAGTQSRNVKISGTLGYVAPEYLLEGMPRFDHLIYDDGFLICWYCFFFKLLFSFEKLFLCL